MSSAPAPDYTFSREVTQAAREAMALLRSLEPVFVASGRLARDLQGRVEAEKKADSGDYRLDVVTEADRAVQAQMLSALVETPLVGCRLLAEETPAEGQVDLRGRFATTSGLYLTLDPIDGTSRFVGGQPYFSTIVGLHDGRRPLYTFMYYPAFDWWVRVCDLDLEMSGPAPVDPAAGGKPSLTRTLVYTVGAPDRAVPAVTAWLRERGADLCFGESYDPSGSKYLYLSGHAGGYFACGPNPYDGLFALHLAMARGSIVLAEGAAPGAPIDFTALESSARGLYHPGWYAVVPTGLCGGGVPD